MATITISYTLSDAGKKASLLAGGTADWNQSLEIDQDHPAFSAAAELAEVANGKLVASVSENQDAPLHEDTVAAAIHREKSRQDEKAKKEAAKLAEEQAAYFGIFEERKTRPVEVGSYGYYVEVELPVQNFGGVIDSVRWNIPGWKGEFEKREDVAAWIAERLAAKEAAIEESKRLKEAADAERKRKEAEQEAAAKAKADEFRTANGLGETDVWFGVEQQCLTKVPCYESHRRGKNWMAIVTKNPKSPGGLDRDFQEKCKGEYYYSVAELSVDDYVEFGADYYTGGGRPDRNRWYGRVTKIDGSFIAFEPCKKSDVK